jgi:hypothetical protein
MAATIIVDNRLTFGALRYIFDSSTCCLAGFHTAVVFQQGRIAFARTRT